MPNVIVSGSFDDLRSRDVRFLEEVARLGTVHVCLWSDQAIAARQGRPPKFPLAERRYLLQALRFVHGLTLCFDVLDPNALPPLDELNPEIWAVDQAGDHPDKRAFCQTRGLEYHVVPDAQLAGFPESAADPVASRGPKVLVTGCYDWLHSGHVRFFEECSAHGELFVVVGHDANIRLLKGAGHPLFSQAERRYLVGAIRYVKQALISSGQGWLDAEPEIQALRPEIYAVNADGDKPEKRDYCARHGIHYLVLKRAPKDGLPARESSILRGF